MVARALTHALVGLEPRRVEVEAHLQSGLPSFAIVGLADRACQEAKHRVRSGIASAELQWPETRITVNLAPAALRKEGTGFDFSIALAVLAASHQIPLERLRDHSVVGELALDGRIRPVAGAIAFAEGARRQGLRRVLCAAESASEACLAGVEALPVHHLAQAVAYLRGEEDLQPAEPPDLDDAAANMPDLADVRGQERGRRALELAAAGRHNLLLIGPPGTGKTMLARRLPGILPPLSRDETLEVTRIHSVAGVLPASRPLMTSPPFRAPHHGASAAAIVGGGTVPRPGEASLAHRGVLLLDELPEFSRAVLEALRQPLEDGFVAVSRVGGAALFPASLRLVGTMNMCPCGGRGDPVAECRCSAQRIGAYQEKVSRALLDRFDLVVAMPRPRAAELAAPSGESSVAVRERVLGARDQLDGKPARRTPAASELLDRAVERLPLSGRGRVRVARVARTVAALTGRFGFARAHRRGPLVPRASRLARRMTTRLTRSSPHYPKLLAAIHDPPPQLWVRGDAGAELLSQASVGVVGARACSSYGRTVARSLSRDLAAAGVVVVSGMARGVDGEAHRGALDAGGATIAVLGCGIDRDYPAAHAELARRISETGLIVSEYEPGVEPAPWRFPARNRIISGLCLAVVVVEARERSGALITVDFALEQGREVLAVPGEITSALSAGANALLRLGAAPVLCVDDVLEAIGVVIQRSAPVELEGSVGLVLAVLRDAPTTADELARATGLPAADVAALLVELELDGRVSSEDGIYRATMAA